MNEIEKIKKEIERTKTVLIESQENLAAKPDDYSAKLLVMSTENYLIDLLKKLDKLNKT